LRFADERILAWCGGAFDVRSGSTSLPAGHAALVHAGEELLIGAPELGCRAWLAISGGIDVPIVLGSRSTDWRARLGGVDGRALRDGDEIPLGPLSQPARSLVDLLSARQFSSWSPPADWASTADPAPILRFVGGADWNRFNDAAHRSFRAETFTVTNDVNRMGARLDGPELKRKEDVAEPGGAGQLLQATPSARHEVKNGRSWATQPIESIGSPPGAKRVDLISEAVAPGTIQVPADGKPIVLLGDCQTIGGYPKIAHVITVDLPMAAQLRGGDRVHFREVSLADAHQLLAEREHDFQCFRTGLSLHAS
jgi:antagonist of KipI